MVKVIDHGKIVKFLKFSGWIQEINQKKPGTMAPGFFAPEKIT